MTSLDKSEQVWTSIILYYFIGRYVWPWAEKDSIGHDSYYCLKYNHNTKPFPTKRKIGPNNFVGAIIAYNETIGPCLSYEKCQHGNNNLCSCTCM